MLDAVHALNRSLRDRLSSLINAGAAPPVAVAARGGTAPHLDVASTPGPGCDPSAPIHVVVSMNEINDRHGTGPLVKRIHAGCQNVFSIRSRNDWGVHDFGDWNVCIPQRDRTRPECFQRVLGVLGGRKVETVLCVPFLVDELMTACAVKESFGARMCVYLMDDQNVASHNISDALMREFLQRCVFRVATHPELRHVYEQKYGLRFYLLPAVVPHALIPAETVPQPPAPNGPRGAILGSFWDQSWFDDLCEVLSSCGCKVDWFGNNKSPWFQFSGQQMDRAGISARGVVPEEQLAVELRKYSFIIIPAGTLNEEEKNKGVASLSLPGRILFALATSHTPLLLVGNPRTCGARFISHFQIGEVVPYDARAIREAIGRLTQAQNQARVRANAARIGPRFSDRGVAEWLADSIRLGVPADDRFEEAFAGYDATLEMGDLPRGAAGR